MGQRSVAARARSAGEGLTGKAPLAGDGEHGGVVDGVAEDGVGGGDADAGEGGDFAFVGGDVEEGVGDEAVGVDGDLGGEDAVGGMLKRRTPSSTTQSQVELTAQISTPADWSSRMRVSISGKMLALDLGGEVFGGGGAHGRIRGGRRRSGPSRRRWRVRRPGRRGSLGSAARGGRWTLGERIRGRLRLPWSSA